MTTAADLNAFYLAFNTVFPQLAQTVSDRHTRHAPEAKGETGALWFETLAAELNDRIGRAAHQTELASVLKYLDQTYRTGTPDVRACVDVSIVENLFWQVPATRAEAGWDVMPAALKDLYLRFHRQPPV